MPSWPDLRSLLVREVHMPLAKLRIWQPHLVRMTSPRCQRYLFFRRVIGEPTATALAMSVGDKLLTPDEMRALAAGSSR